MIVVLLLCCTCLGYITAVVALFANELENKSCCLGVTVSSMFASTHISSFYLVQVTNVLLKFKSKLELVLDFPKQKSDNEYYERAVSYETIPPWDLIRAVPNTK